MDQIPGYSRKYGIAVITLIVVILAGILLARTCFGRNVYATGGNREAARLAGVKVGRVQATP